MANNLGVGPNHPFRANADKIAKLAEPIYRLLNVKNFAFVRFYWNKTYFSLGSNRDIDDFYWDNNLNEVGGPVHDLAYTPTPVVVHEYANPDSEYGRKVIAPIREKFGLAHSVAYLRNYLGYSELVILSADEDNKTLLRDFYVHQKAIKQFIRYFKYKGKDILKAAKKQKLKYEINRPERNLHNADCPVTQEARDRFMKAIQTKRYYLDGFGDETYLSRRELQCLNLAVRGYTFKKIASELFLSARTVEAHINSVRNKLGIKTKKEISSDIEFSKELTALIKEFDTAVMIQNVNANHQSNSSVHVSLSNKVETIIDPMFFNTEEGNKIRPESEQLPQLIQEA